MFPIFGIITFCFIIPATTYPTRFPLSDYEIQYLESPSFTWKDLEEQIRRVSFSCTDFLNSHTTSLISVIVLSCCFLCAVALLIAELVDCMSIPEKFPQCHSC